MDEQMEMAFGEAERVDPVSGNDVPPGSLPEEVRDDIPAMLSEGEYVVPADVLRFYGVKFFEDLRNEAKMGLANMEANGRIGGEPVMDEELPFSDEELMSMDMPDMEEVAAAKGGLMGFQEGGLNYPAYIKQPDLSFLGGEQGGTGLEYRVYVNEAGMTITIPFFDGEPMGMIPPGYTPQGSTPAATDDDSMGGVTDTGEDDNDDTPKPSTGPSISEMTGKQLAEEAANAEKATAIASALPGLLGTFLGFAAKSQQKAINARAAELGLVEPEKDPQRRSWAEQDDAGILTAKAMTPEQVQEGIEYAKQGDDRDTSWQGGKVVENQSKPKSDDKDSPEQAAAKAKAKAESAAKKLGVDLATGGKATGGLMQKKKKKK